MSLYFKILHFAFICTLLAGCSEHSTPKNEGQVKVPEQIEEPHLKGQNIVESYIQVLDKPPERVTQLKKLSVFRGDLKPLYNIELIPVQTYGRTGEYYLTSVEGLTVDKNDNVIVTNIGANYEPTLQVFNVEGTYLAPLGRTGRGPGEYLRPWFVDAGAGSIYVYDIFGKRVNAYDTDDYSFTRSTLMERWDILKHNELKGWEFGGLEVRSDGNILAKFFKTKRIEKASSRLEEKYLLMDLDGNKLNYTPFSYNTELRIVDDKDVTFPNIFPIGRTLTAISNEGELFAVNTQQMLIKKYNSKGIYKSAIYYPVEGKSLNLDQFLKSERKFGPTTPKVDAIKKAYQDIGEEIPKSSPVADKLIVDDENRIWVAVPAGKKYNFYEWWVLAETGKLLAKVTLPIEKQIHDIKNGFLYTKEIDEETSADYVVKYRIDLTKISMN